MIIFGYFRDLESGNIALGERADHSEWGPGKPPAISALAQAVGHDAGCGAQQVSLRVNHGVVLLRRRQMASGAETPSGEGRE